MRKFTIKKIPVLISIIIFTATFARELCADELEKDQPAKQLFVNKSGKHYYAKIDRSTGEGQLQILAHKSDREEAWVYIEGDDTKGNQTTLWYEVGENSRSAFADIDFNAVGLSIKESRLHNITVSLYHFHPKSNDPTQGVTATETPSPPDIKALFFCARLLSIKHNYKGPFDSRIVTPTGVYTMQDSAEVNRWDDKQFIEYESTLYETWERLRSNLFDVGKYRGADKSDKIADINNEIAQIMTKEPHFIVTFRKLPNKN